ncbi:MAG: hypothetical protein ACOYIG_12280, partial [Acetivibrionales bacterium]
TKAKTEPDKERAKKYLEAAQKLADTEDIDIFNRPEYQKTAKQVLGEAVGTALETLSFGTFGKATTGLKSFQLGKAGVPTLIKPLTRGKNILYTAKTGAKYGSIYGAGFGASEAMIKDKSIGNIVQESLIGAAGGALVGGVLGGGITAGSQGIAGLTSRASKLSQKGRQIIGEKAYEQLVKTSRSLLKMSPTKTKNEVKWNKNTPEFIANEFIIDPDTLKPKSILQLIDSDGRRIDTTDAVSALRGKYRDESRAFNSLIKDSGEYTSFNQLRDRTIREISDEYKFKGSDYEDALKYLNKEIDAYKRNFREIGLIDGDDVLIPVSEMSKIKSGLWDKTSNFNPSQADKLLSDLNYRMGQVAKELVEENVEDVAVKKMNQRLGDFASAIKVLQDAQGKVVPGGFFGRQLTRIAGTIAGTPGGVAGSLLGNITGGVLADLAANPKIKTTLWSKIVSQLYRQNGGQSIIDDAVKILQKRGQQRASIKLLEAPKFIPLTPKSGASGLMSQDEAQKLINELRKIDPNILPKGKGEIPKTTTLLKAKGETLKTSASNFITKAYKEAPLAKTEIDSIASTLAKKYKGKVASAPLKKQEKVIFNIKNKYNGDSSRVSDIARNTIIVSPDDTSKVFKELQKNPNYFGGKFVDPKTDPLGYSGYNTKYRASNGHIAEIQINTPEMIYAKEPAESAITQLGEKLYNQLDMRYNGIGGKGHLYYDDWVKARTSQDITKANEIEKTSSDYYNLFR